MYGGVRFSHRFDHAPPDDCAKLESAYELVAKGGPEATCPDGKREKSIYSILASESVTLCFVLNLKQGQCYMRTHGGPVATMNPVPCDDKRFAQIEVAKRVEGSTDSTQCPPDATTITYPKPARLYRLVPASS